MSSETTTTGTLGVLAVTTHLLEYGYEIYTGVTGAESTDLVAYKSGKFTRVQVKSRVLKKGAVGFPRVSGGYRAGKTLKGDEFDVMAVYLRDKRFCLFMSMKELTQNLATVSVRVEPAKNGAKKNVRSYEVYTSFENAVRM